MSLRRRLRNLRKRKNYDLTKRPPEGVSFDLTTEDGRAAERAWALSHPLNPPPKGWTWI